MEKNGAAERIEERIKLETEGLNEEKRLKVNNKWERKKWLLVRYAVYDQLTFDEIKIYAGVTSSARAGQLFQEGLRDLWVASTLDIQQKFPKEEVISGKRTGKEAGYELSPEHRAKISAASKGKVFSEEHRTKIKISKMGHEVTPETRKKISEANTGQVRSEESRARISAAQRERYRRERVQKQQVVFQSPNSQN